MLIPISDNGEKLIGFDSSEFLLEPMYYQMGYTDSPRMLLRSGCIDRLRQVQSWLRSKGEYKLKIWDGYRTLGTQKAIYDDFYKRLERENPNWSEEKLHQEVEKFVFPPHQGSLNPPTHNTGGAVDLTIVTLDGQELPMGSFFDDFSLRAYPDYYITEGKDDPDAQQYHTNRLLLKEAMQHVGFVGHPHEWWHFSYGTPEWARALGQDIAIYGGAMPD